MVVLIMEKDGIVFIEKFGFLFLILEIRRFIELNLNLDSLFFWNDLDF